MNTSLSKETELCLYIELEDPSFETDTSFDVYKQYESLLENKTKIRTRVYESDNRCLLTIKLKTADIAGISTVDEYTTLVPIGFADGFIKAASSVQHKRRDYFKSNSVVLKMSRGDEVEVHDAPELSIELDRFIKQDGSYSKWAKVDIEVNDLISWIKSTYSKDKVDKYSIDFENILPCKVLRIIQSTTTDPEEKSILSDLWDNEFKVRINN